MHKYTVLRNGQRPLEFQGDELASSESSMDRARTDFSGVTGRALKVTVYRTAAGKIVVAKMYKTLWHGEHDHDEAKVYDSLNEALDALVDHCPAWQYAELVDALGADRVAEKVD